MRGDRRQGEKPEIFETPFGQGEREKEGQIE